jgi:hypothetical protein
MFRDASASSRLDSNPHSSSRLDGRARMTKRVGLAYDHGIPTRVRVRRCAGHRRANWERRSCRLSIDTVSINPATGRITERRGGLESFYGSSTEGRIGRIRGRLSD